MRIQGLSPERRLYLPLLAVVVLGGLITSTALTLLVIPALYARFGTWLLPSPLASPQP